MNSASTVNLYCFASCLNYSGKYKAKYVGYINAKLKHEIWVFEGKMPVLNFGRREKKPRGI